MSIYQIQEQLRGLPDDALLREMQQPSGAAPQYLILTEIERRQQLRRGAQAAPSTQTVAQELAQGLAGIPSLPQGPAMPGGQMPAQMPPGADAGIAAMQQPQGFAGGGEVDGKVDPGIEKLKRYLDQISKDIWLRRAQKKYDDESGGVEHLIDWKRGEEMSRYPDKITTGRPILGMFGGTRLPSGKHAPFLMDGGDSSLDDLAYAALNERMRLQKSLSERKGEVSTEILRDVTNLLRADETYRRLAARRDLANQGYEVDAPGVFGGSYSSILQNTPKGPGYSSGGEVDGKGKNMFEQGMFGGAFPMKGLIDWAAERWDQKGPFGFGLISLLQDGFTNDPKKGVMDDSGDVTPETSINSNMTPTKAPVAFAGGDLVLSPTPILRNMIYGIESMGGKDLNSIASGGKYIGPGQMNAASYADAARYAKKLYPEMNFPSWNNKWVGSPEGKRPKDYPNKSQWNALTEGYIEFSKDMLKRRGIPVSDATVYGAYNLGIGNLSKLFSNPNSPMSEVLSSSVVSQNKFNPNFKWSDVVGELGRRLGKDVAKQPSLSDTLYGMIPGREDISAVLARFAPQAPKPDATSLENIRPRESYASPPRQVPPSPPTTKMIDRSKDPYGEGMVSPGAALPPVIADMMKRNQAGARADDFESILNRITGPNPFPNMAPAPRPPQPQYQPEMMQRPKDQPDEIGDLIRSLNAKRDMAQEKRKKRLGYAEGGIIGYLAGDNAMKQNPSYLMNDFEKFVTGTDRAGDYASPDAANSPYDSSKPWLPGKYYIEPTAPDVTSPRFRPIKGLYDSMMGKIYGPDTFGGAPIFPAADTETGTPSRSIADIYAELEALGKAGEMSPELKGLFNELKRDRQQEMWLSLAQFGANLAAGQSPYFAENLGNATKAGIQTLIEGDRAAKGDIGAMINATLMDQQNRDVNRRNLISTASDIYRSDQEYRRVLDAARLRAKELASKGATESQIVSDGKVAEGISKLWEKMKEDNRYAEMPDEQIWDLAKKRFFESEGAGQRAGVGIRSIKSPTEDGPVALDTTE